MLKGKLNKLLLLVFGILMIGLISIHIRMIPRKKWVAKGICIWILFRRSCCLKLRVNIFKVGLMMRRVLGLGVVVLAVLSAAMLSTHALQSTTKQSVWVQAFGGITKISKKSCKQQKPTTLLQHFTLIQEIVVLHKIIKHQQIM